MNPSVSHYGLIEPFELQVSRGQIPGHSTVQLSGYNPDVGTAWEPVWSDGTLTLPTAATLMTLSSGSTADSPANGGAHTVIVSGLDANYAPISETVTLNGQTAVSTANAYLRINGLSVASAGTTHTAQGIIYLGSGTVTLGVPAVIYDQIPLDWNARQTACYTVPAGFTAFVTYSRLTFAQVGGSNAVWGRLTVTAPGGVKMASVAVVANNGVIEFQPKYPVRIPGRSTILSESKGANTGNFVSTVIQLLLVQD